MKRTIRGSVATLAIAGMIVVGIPTLAFAQAAPPVETTETSDTATPPDSLTDDSVTTLTTDDPAGEQTVETPTAETPPAETPPAETPPAVDPPAEDPPATDPAAEDPPAETPPADDPPVETPDVVTPEETATPPAPQQRMVQPLAAAVAGPNDAVINVKVRSGAAGVSPAGVKLQLYTATNNNTDSPGTKVNDAWATCTSDTAGDCSFTVPITGTSNRDKRFWVVPLAAPAGYYLNNSLVTGDNTNSGNSRFAQTPYQYRTGTQLRAGETYNTVPAINLMPSSSTINSPLNTTSGATSNRWKTQGAYPVSLNNNRYQPTCTSDLTVAIVLDLSLSMSNNNDQGLNGAKTAAKNLVKSLIDTGTSVALYTFSTDAPASNGNDGRNWSAQIVTAANAGTTQQFNNNDLGSTDSFYGKINNYDTHGYTNWDRGLLQVAPGDYDIAVVVTDGNPTVWGSNPSEQTWTTFQHVENAVYSANAVKATGTQLLAFGVGDGISAVPGDNLRAVSGTVKWTPGGGSIANADYAQTNDWALVSQQLAALAQGVTCSVPITVHKVEHPLTGADVPGEGWEFTPTLDGDGALSPVGAQTTPANGTVSWNLKFSALDDTADVTIAETPQDLWDFGSVACTNNGVSFDVDNASTFALDGLVVGDSIDCTVVNNEQSASVTVNKQWVVNGTSSALNVIPDGFTTDLSLTDQSDPQFGTNYPGYATGDELNINETYATPPACEPVVSTIAGASLPEGGYPATLAQGENSYTITNSVTCDTTLELVKSVNGGPEQPSSWDLTATGPTSFTVDSGDVTDVTPGKDYALSEAGKAESPNTNVYVQVGDWSCSLDGGAAASGSTTNVPLGHSMVCTVTNQTAQLTLLKQVEGDASPSDFDLTATPTGDTRGVTPTTVDGAVAPNDDNTFAIRPGLTYNLTEDGPDGYSQQSLQCWLPGGDPVDATSVTATANQSWTCEFTNAAVAPQLKLTKIVAPPATVDPTEWNLTAKIDGDIVAGGDGGTAGFVDVPAGEDITLAETTEIENASEFTASAWTCTINEGDPETLTAGLLPKLSAGDKADCTITNSLKRIIPTITKTVDAASPVSNADGTWTIGYDIVVTNPSNFASIEYDLSDTLQFGSDVTVNSATYQLTPDGLAVDFTPPLNEPTVFATDFDLGVASSDTWHVIANATVGAGADFANPTIGECLQGDSGEVGFLNTAVLTYNGQSWADEDCALPVDPQLTKVGGTAVDNGDGTWTLPYTITVFNPSATTSVIYDLQDALDLPDGVTVSGTPTVTAAAGTPAPNVAGWTGVAPDVNVTNDISLAGGVTHTYNVSVPVKIGTSVDPADLVCPSDNGLNNTATLLSGNQSHQATGCVPVETPEITHTKTVGDTHQDADGTWSVSYTVTVDNDSDIGGVYTLNDELRFGTGIDLDAAAFAVQLNGAGLGNGWNGGTQQNLATDRYLAPGTDTYVITVSGIVVPEGVIGSEAGTCPTDEINDTGAFNNRAILVTGGDESTKADCDVPTAPTPTKSGATSAQQPDGSWNVSYTITVDNSQGKAGYYSLTDVPLWDASTVTINSWTVTGVPIDPNITTWDGTGVIIPADAQQAIDAGATHVYTVIFNVDIPSGVPADIADCTTGETANHGFVNEVIMVSGGEIRDDRDCTPMTDAGVPTVEKGDPSTVQNNDGTWTMVYPITVTGNATYVTKYSLTDTLSYAPAVPYNSASWQQLPGGPVGNWDFEDSLTQTLATNRSIGVGEVQTYQVTVNASVDKDAFGIPSTNTCVSTFDTPLVGFRNIATLTSGTTTQTDDGCSTPAQPEFTKTVNPGQPVKDGDNWVVSYTLTATNTNPTQALVYDLTDTPDFPSGAVSIESRAVTSADVTVNPDWNSGDSDTVVSNETLPGGATHTFTVAVTFSVLDTATDVTEFRCATDSNPDGQGLLNGAVLTSGDDYADEDCADIPVKVLVKKYWSINGTIMSGGNPLDGFSATLVLDPAPADGTTGWGETEDGYAPNSPLNIDETYEIPEGCAITNQTGLGDVTLDKPLNEFDVTNTVVCGQTLTLNKDVFNNHGGDAADVDWNLSATAPDDDDPTNFAGNGTASGDVTAGLTYTLAESSTEWDDNGYQVKTTWQCSSPQGDGAFTLVGEDGSQSASVSVDIYGASVSCWIENEDIAPTLTLRKSVMPLGVSDPDNWMLTGTPADDTAPIVTGNGYASETVVANVEYTLTEAPLADFPYGDDFTAGEWDCTVGVDPAMMGDDGTVTLAPGENVTCVIVNTANPADLTIDKTLVSSDQLSDGTWDLEYDVTVQNLSDLVAARYDLTDAPEFGAGIDINSASAEGPSSQAATWSDTNDVLATDTEILKAETDVYTISINATVTEDSWNDGTTECKEIGDGGFRNTAWMSTGDKPAVSATACGEPGQLTIEKTSVGAPFGIGDGDWELGYTVTVTNASDEQLYYDLSDTLGFAEGTTIVSSEATNDAGVDTSAWTGEAPDTQLANDEAIAAAGDEATVHTYTIAVVANVDDVTNTDLITCESTTTGHGFFNGALLENGTVKTPASACEDIPVKVQVDKVWVVNGVEFAEGDQPAPLTAELILDPVPDGTMPAWGEMEDGYALGSSVNIDETYAAPEACTVTNDGTGDFELDKALNHFTVTNTVECEADPTIAKTLTSNVQNADGTWTLEYDVTVTNPSNLVPIEYDLEDELQFGEGIQVNSADATGPSDQAADWNGDSNTALATDQVVAYDDADVYTVTVNATVTEQAWTDDTVECLPDGTPGGFRNTATVRTGGVEAPTAARSTADSSDATAFEASATDCGEPGHATVAKTVLGAPTKNADGTWKVRYGITVTNGSEHDLYYDLVDAPHFAAGTSIVGASAKVNGTTIPGWDASKPLADDRLIGAADGEVPTQDVYTVEFTVNISGVASAANAKCDGAGTGLFNTADMTNGTLSYSSSACAPFTIPAKPAHIASTGFDGGWLLPIGGGAILLGAVGLYLLRRRRPLADDQQM